MSLIGLAVALYLLGVATGVVALLAFAVFFCRGGGQIQIKQN